MKSRKKKKSKRAAEAAELRTLGKRIGKAKARGKSRKKKNPRRSKRAQAAALLKQYAKLTGKNPLPLLVSALAEGAGVAAGDEAFRKVIRRQSVKKKKSKKRRARPKAKTRHARSRPRARAKRKSKKRNPRRRVNRITHALAVGSSRNIVQVGSKAVVDKAKKLLRKAGVRRRLLIGKRV